MLPDVRHDLDRAMRAISEAGLSIQTEFPMAEFLTSIGLFVILLLEEVNHSLCEVYLSPNFVVEVVYF